MPVPKPYINCPMQIILFHPSQRPLTELFAMKIVWAFWWESSAMFFTSAHCAISKHVFTELFLNFNSTPKKNLQTYRYSEGGKDQLTKHSLSVLEFSESGKKNLYFKFCEFVTNPMIILTNWNAHWRSSWWRYQWLWSVHRW